MEMGFKLILAAMMLFFVWRLWPAAKNHFEHGPKGSSNDWMTFGLLIGGVILFVLVLMKLV